MRRRRYARTVAALAAVLLASSTLGVCFTPRATAAQKDCCKKRCHQQASDGVAGCCCAAPATPATTGVVPADAKPSLAAPVTIAPAPTAVELPAPALHVARSHAPPGGPLFLQRCTLLL